MKRALLPLFLPHVTLLLLAACATPPAPRLLFADEFSVDGPPDPARWGHETGFVRNEEAQFYTPGRPANARVEGGLLVIEARREAWPNPAHVPGSSDWRAARATAEYTSASLHTRGLFAVRYGRIEARARVPRGAGVWPAFWTLGADRPRVGWPRCGEIDVMEYVGKEPHVVWGTAHWGVGQGHRSRGGRIELREPWADFHVFSVAWCPERIEWFLDGTRYHVLELDEVAPAEDNPLRRPHELILNLALGGTWGGPIDDAALPARLLVDWVRVWELPVGPADAAR